MQHVSLAATTLDWRARAREVADSHVRPVAWKYDRLQEYPWEVQEQLKAHGLFGVFVPEEYGGASGRAIDICVVVEELSRACRGIGVGFAALPALDRHGRASRLVRAVGAQRRVRCGVDEQIGHKK